MMAEKLKLSQLSGANVQVESEPERISLSSLKPEEIKVEQEVKPKRTLTPVESVLTGAGQGLSMGFLDEGIAAGKAAYGALTSDKEFSQLYDTMKKEQRAYVDAAKLDNPASFFLGQMGGAAGSMFVPGLNVLAPAKGASLAANVGKAALGGGIAAAGLSTADPIASPAGAKEFASEVIGGAALGGLLQYGTGKIGDIFASLKPASLRGFAEEKAVKAAGAMTKEMRELADSGQLHKVGRELLDKKIVTIFSSLDEISEKATRLKKDAGQAIGASLKQVDDLVSNTEKMIDEGKLFGFLPDEQTVAKLGSKNLPTKEAAKNFIRKNFQFNMANVGNRIKEELVEPNKTNPFLSQELNRLTTIADDFLTKAQSVPTMKLEAARQIKTTLGKKTRFASETVPEQFKKEVYDIVATEIEGLVGKIGNIEQAVLNADASLEDLIKANLKKVDVGQAGKLAQEAFKKANELYGVAKTAEKMSRARLGAERSNRGISLTDTIAGVGGFATGAGAIDSTLKGIGLLIANKIGRKYGASAQAVLADKVAEILAKSPSKLGKFGAALEEQAKHGVIPMLTTHRMFLKDPDYQNILLNFEPEQRGLRLPIQRGLSLPGR